MAVDISAGKIIEMIDRLYDGRRIVPKTQVLAEAVHSGIGRDGMRAVESLPSRDYTEEQLNDALAAAVIGED